MKISTFEYQICYLCHRTSLDTPFYLNKARFNGYDSACKACKKSIKRRPRARTDAHRRASKKFYETHKDSVLAAQRERYANDPEYREKAKQRSYRSRLRRKYLSPP